MSNRWIGYVRKLFWNVGVVVFRMGGHGHGHGEPYQIPDYKTFKIEGIKQLEDLEAALAKKCLKDPWIRYCVAVTHVLVASLGI